MSQLLLLEENATDWVAETTVFSSPRSEGSRSRMKVLEDLVPGENLLLGLQTTVFSLYLHIVEGGQGQEERQRSKLPGPCFKRWEPLAGSVS